LPESDLQTINPTSNFILSLYTDPMSSGCNAARMSEAIP
jgi:hypothetical protein